MEQLALLFVTALAADATSATPAVSSDVYTFHGTW